MNIPFKLGRVVCSRPGVSVRHSARLRYGHGLLDAHSCWPRISGGHSYRSTSCVRCLQVQSSPTLGKLPSFDNPSTLSTPVRDDAFTQEPEADIDVSADSLEDALAPCSDTSTTTPVSAAPVTVEDVMDEFFAHLDEFASKEPTKTPNTRNPLVGKMDGSDTVQDLLNHFESLTVSQGAGKNHHANADSTYHQPTQLSLPSRQRLRQRSVNSLAIWEEEEQWRESIQSVTTNLDLNLKLSGFCSNFLGNEELVTKADPKTLQTAIVMCRSLKQLPLAYTVLKAIRNQGLDHFVSWVDAGVYHELLCTEWELRQDVQRVRRLVADITSYGIECEENTYRLLEDVREFIKQFGSQEDFQHWNGLTHCLASLIPLTPPISK